MDADRHIASLNRTYFFLIVVTVTLGILFFQQYRKSLNAFTVRRLDLTVETYNSFGSIDLENFPAKAQNFYDDILGREVSGAFVLHKVAILLKNIHVYTTIMRITTLVYRVENLFYHFLHPGISHDLPYPNQEETHGNVRDTYRLSAISSPFSFGGYCSAIAVRGPPTEQVHVGGGTLPMSDFYALIYSYGCIDNDYRVAIITKSLPSLATWTILIPEDSYYQVTPENRFSLGVAATLPVNFDMTAFLHINNQLFAVKDSLPLQSLVNAAWESPSGIVTYIPVTAQDMEHAIVLFSQKATGIQRDWADVHGAVEDVVRSQQVSATIGSVALDLGYWLVIAPVLITGCIFLLQRRMAVLERQRRSGHLLVSGPWLLKETNSVLDMVYLAFWAIFPLVTMITWGLVYTYSLKRVLNIDSLTFSIFKQENGPVSLPILNFEPGSLIDRYSNALLVLWIAGSFFALVFLRDTFRLWRRYQN